MDKENLLALLVGMQTGEATLENSMEVPQKVKNKTTLWSSNCTPRYLHKGYKNTNGKWYIHPDVYSSIINNSQIMEVGPVSTDGWMNKNVVYKFNGILLSHKNNKILSFANTWIDLESIMQSIINQSEKHKHHEISLICGI